MARELYLCGPKHTYKGDIKVDEIDGVRMMRLCYRATPSTAERQQRENKMTSSSSMELYSFPTGYPSHGHDGRGATARN